MIFADPFGFSWQALGADRAVGNPAVMELEKEGAELEGSGQRWCSQPSAQCHLHHGFLTVTNKGWHVSASPSTYLLLEPSWCHRGVLLSVGPAACIQPTWYLQHHSYSHSCSVFNKFK